MKNGRGCFYLSSGPTAKIRHGRLNASQASRMSVALFLSVFLIAGCGLIYELIAGTLASYLLGDSVFQFSAIIGCYLFAMGIGSYLLSFLMRSLARFVSIELMVGLVGGFSSSLLFLAFAYTEAFRLVLYIVVILVGTLVGLEIHLLMRIPRSVSGPFCRAR
jgi:spermidine synthase